MSQRLKDKTATEALVIMLCERHPDLVRAELAKHGPQHAPPSPAPAAESDLLALAAAH